MNSMETLLEHFCICKVKVALAITCKSVKTIPGAEWKNGYDSWMWHTTRNYDPVQNPLKWARYADTRGKGNGKCNSQPPEMYENNETEENKTIWENIFQSLIIKSIKCRQAFVSFYCSAFSDFYIASEIMCSLRKCYPHVNNKVKQLGGSAVPLACQKKHVRILKRFLSCGCQKTS